jgi:hypothetical protein
MPGWEPAFRALPFLAVRECVDTIVRSYSLQVTWGQNTQVGISKFPGREVENKCGLQ